MKATSSDGAEKPGSETRFLGIAFFETVTEEVEGKRNPRETPENNKKKKETQSDLRKRESGNLAASVRNKKKPSGIYLREVSADRP